MSEIRLEVEQGIATLTLNRAGAGNALNFPTLCRLREVVREISCRRDIRVVVLTGAGEKFFCAGADLKERKTMSEQQVREFLMTIRDTFTEIADLPQPVIGVMNGYAFGGGLELALSCDMRIVESHVQLGLTETSLGIIPGAGGTQRLARLIGSSKAKELIFTARRLTSAEALDWGIASYVEQSRTGMEKALELASQMCANAPLALAQAKFAIDRGLEADIRTGIWVEAKAYETLLPTEDRLEGLRAFAEKRKPNYQGK
ncbi:Enoyl-CoA hydratase/carnithine racemase [Thermoactinomyces sp. DSM 45891]|uniref:enoyl-CoA hydratase-related protein n=1 Tax=Thermoactinomyces sp. DSM 45891 TaxID=1761907 RepID=UPI0009191830|nr:enoyl-CoA hydratase-related protein [Thermoactinomyces sp. DSM 45891]SFX27196.1 Enoyl-CoA hydratase/carnithine racemase [Thermoactinomyces sp. DSM 45891]